MDTLSLPSPYLIFLGDVPTDADAKTGFGLRDWAPERCVGELALPDCPVTLNLPRLSPAAAKAAGAKSLIIGVAPMGGRIPDNWVPYLIAALEAGLDLISGMHMRLGSIPEVAAVAARLGRGLWDVRHANPAKIPVGTGRKRTGKRLLTVGTDCALGKKYTALTIARELRARGAQADFRATGQTGIMIGGGGIAIDAVIADFVAGAAESLSPDAAPDHWDIVEGQGSLYHPAYAGVTLGLLHGTQPDLLVLCHQPGRLHIHGLVDYQLPALVPAIRLYEELARITNPAVRCVAVSLNTSALDAHDAARELGRTAEETGLPAFDPIRGIGLAAALDAIQV